MPGKGTPPGPSLYPECAMPGMRGPNRHRKEGTPTCAHCRAEVAGQAARYRKRRYLARGPLQVPALGTQRRLRALARAGWPQEQVGLAMGLSRTAVNKILSQGEVHLSTAEKFAAFYREHAFQVGPSRHVQGIAERLGWPGPMDWDDPDNPDEVPACEVERAHAEALEIARAMRKMQAKRERRAQMTEAEREAALERQRARRRDRAA